MSASSRVKPMARPSPTAAFVWRTLRRPSPPGTVPHHPSSWTSVLGWSDFQHESTHKWWFRIRKPRGWGYSLMVSNGPSHFFSDLRCLYIPCAFVTHFGKCIDEKTPLLRSMDAVTLSGLRLLKAIGIATDAKALGLVERKQSWNPARFCAKTRDSYRLLKMMGKSLVLESQQPERKKSLITKLLIPWHLLPFPPPIPLTFRPCAATWVGSRSSLWCPLIFTKPDLTWWTVAGPCSESCPRGISRGIWTTSNLSQERCRRSIGIRWHVS